MTKAIIDIAGPLGISVHDHIIVGKNGHASMKGLRLISRRYRSIGRLGGAPPQQVMFALVARQRGGGFERARASS